MEISEMKNIIVLRISWLELTAEQTELKGLLVIQHTQIYPRYIRKYINMSIEISMSINKNTLIESIQDKAQRGKGIG